MAIKNKKRENKEVTKVLNEKVAESPKDLTKKQKIQLVWFFSIIAIVFLAFLGTYFYVQSLKKFEYLGVDWVKEEYTGLTLYHSRFPITYQGVTNAFYNLYLRNDPRKNNVSMEDINLQFAQNVTISNTPDAAKCRDAARVTGDLGMFLRAFPWIKNINGAVTDKNLSKELDLVFANCSSATEENTVIIIQRSNNPSISVIQDRLVDPACYVISIGNCENTLAVEKFMAGIVGQMGFKKIK